MKQILSFTGITRSIKHIIPPFKISLSSLFKTLNFSMSRLFGFTDNFTSMGIMSSKVPIKKSTSFCSASLYKYLLSVLSIKIFSKKMSLSSLSQKPKLLLYSTWALQLQGQNFSNN